MKITIVMGFFLPMPPESGGATEKTWDRLARELSAQGHQVTIVSRTWRQWPVREAREGVCYLRAPGFDHRRKLWQNLFLDLIWSVRVHRHLPDGDIVVVHAVALPVWLGKIRPEAGRVVVMPGRMPKGQYRFYHRIARVLATSTPVRDRVLAENPALAPALGIYGYPIDCQTLGQPRSASASEIVIGFAGRLHPEKGLDLLVDAALLLESDSTLPVWRLDLRGPEGVAAGGAGASYRLKLEKKLRAGLHRNQWRILPPIFRDDALADFYRSVDVFCYPSLAENGETFGVAVAEAMAAGAAPVVSDLACFRDFVRPGENGLVFDHHGSDASARLAEALAVLLRDPIRRARLAASAQADVRRYDFPIYADSLVRDFQTLLRS